MREIDLLTKNTVSEEEDRYDWKRYVRQDQVISECRICNEANGKLHWMHRLSKICNNGNCFKLQKHKPIAPHTFLTQHITRIYCHAMYERTKEAQIKFHEEGKALKERKEGLWMLSTNDNIIKIVEPSALPQVGGLMEIGNVELMSMKYFLRQSSRRYGINYQEAANMLIDWHQKVGMPQKGKSEIRNELDQVFSIISDDVVKKQMLTRLEDASEEVEGNDSQIAAPAIVGQVKNEHQEDLDIYYQFPMTWLTSVANANVANKEQNTSCDKRNFRYKRLSDMSAPVNKKCKCMEKLLKSIAKKQAEARMKSDTCRKEKANATLLREVESAIEPILKPKTTKRYRKEKAKVEARIAKELSNATVEHEQANVAGVANEYEHTNLTCNES